MKFFFSVKINLALLLILTILAVLFLDIKGEYKEGYYGTISDGPEGQEVRYQRLKDEAADKSGVYYANRFGKQADSDLKSARNSITSNLNKISDFIDTEPKINTPKWRSIYGNGVKVPDTITTGLKPDTSLILTSGCSSKSIVKSQYEEDICTTYAGDYPVLDTKCKGLSNSNCNLPACCVLINGTKCVAGDANGPTYLTDQGNEIDYKYYLYRNKCYGNGCNDAGNNYLEKCGKYAKNSTGVSKECMIEMFNQAGCENKNPTFVINDDYAYNNSRSSKQYIELDLKETAKTLLRNISKGNDDSRIKCNADQNNPCDKFLSDSDGINKACMIRMYNDNGCPNTVPPIITNSFEYNYRYTNKNDLKTIIKNAMGSINPESVDCKGS